MPKSSFGRIIFLVTFSVTGREGTSSEYVTVKVVVTKLANIITLRWQIKILTIS